MQRICRADGGQHVFHGHCPGCIPESVGPERDDFRLGFTAAVSAEGDIQQGIEFHPRETYDPDANEVIRKLYLKDDMAAIEDAVRLLPDRCRQIFRMSYIDGMSHKEIALKLGITVSTVDNHIYKALKMLRDNLSDPRIYMLVLFSLFFR